MTTNSLNKCEALSSKSLLKELPYFNFTGSLVMLHGQFNNGVQTSKATRNNKLTSLYDLSLFNLNSNLDVNINPLVNLSNLQIRSRYFSPHSFVQTTSKISKMRFRQVFPFFIIMLLA